MTYSRSQLASEEQPYIWYKKWSPCDFFNVFQDYDNVSNQLSCEFVMIQYLNLIFLVFPVFEGLYLECCYVRKPANKARGSDSYMHVIPETVEEYGPLSGDERITKWWGCSVVCLPVLFCHQMNGLNFTKSQIVEATKVLLLYLLATSLRQLAS